MMKKRWIFSAFAAVLTFGLLATAHAHDGWSQVNTPIIAQGEVVYVDLLFGNHSNDHKSYRIAGQWSPDSSNVYVTTPAGRKVDITATRFYTGEAATETEPAVNNGFVASFSASAPGAYIISVEGDSIFRSGETASRTLRSAKSFVAVSDIPVPDRVRYLTGFAKAVTPDRAEFVPLFNPAAVTPNREVAVQLLLKGEPLANAEVTLIRRSNSDAQTFVTDDEGRVAFTTGPADYYLLRAKPASDEKQEGEYDMVNYEATMTFIVQNGTAHPAGTPPVSDPMLYVNGRLVAADGLTLENGTTYAGAALIREHLDPAYAGEERVPLRAYAESIGASVEYFPATGYVPPAVLIYTK